MEVIRIYLTIYQFCYYGVIVLDMATEEHHLSSSSSQYCAQIELSKEQRYTSPILGNCLIADSKLEYKKIIHMRSSYTLFGRASRESALKCCDVATKSPQRFTKYIEGMQV